MADQIAFIFGPNAQKVLILELLGVAGRLERRHLKVVLRWEHLGQTFLFLGEVDLIADLTQIDGHELKPIVLSSCRPWDSCGSNLPSRRLSYFADLLSQNLLDVKYDRSYWKLAVWIVDSDFTFCLLCWSKNVLIELAWYNRISLFTAIQDGSVNHIPNRILLLQLHLLLPHNEHLLEDHIFGLIFTLKPRLDKVLHFGLGGLIFQNTFEVKTRRDPLTQLKAKSNHIVAC